MSSKDEIVGYINYLTLHCDVSIKAIEKYKLENSELMNEITEIREDLISVNKDEDIEHLDNLRKKLNKIELDLRSNEEIDRYFIGTLPFLLVGFLKAQ